MSPSTDLPVRLESASPFAPFAPAFASLDAADAPSASMVIAPPAASERAVVASTEWSASVKAIEKPIALSGAVVEPVAFVDADAVWSAWIVSVPVVTSVPPACVPMAALVSTIEIATAMTGVTASAPSRVVFAPFFASTTD